MGRHQAGYLYKTSGGWHVRYWITELKDGKPVRVQKSQKLCDAEVNHEKVTKSYAKDRRDEYMKGINALSGNNDTRDLSVKEFWESQYLPHLEKHKRPSTLIGYKQIWNQHLEPHFVATRLTMREYGTPQATRLLTSLAEKGLGRRSVAHVRSLASGLFRHAKQLGIILENPWRESGSLVKPKEPQPTQNYTLEEAEAIANALHEAGHQREQLIFCIAAFAGLRPGEIAGLQWPDICENEEREIGGGRWTGWVHIRRAVVCGEVGKTKTDESVAAVPLIPELRLMLSAWRTHCANGSTRWVFENRVGDPINLDVVARNVIIPTLRAKGLTWKGLYSGRRSAGTLLTQLTGNALAAFYVLRHKDLATTTGFYIKATAEPAVAGMRLLGERMAERKLKALAASTEGTEQ